MKIEDRIKLVRENAGLKNKEFGESIGISEKTSYNYEKDASKVQISLLNKIVDIYNIDFTWLVTGIGDMEKKVDTGKYETIVPTIQNIEKNNEITNKFEDHESALLANEYLLNMEKKSPKDFLLAVGYLKGVSDSIDRKSQDLSDRRKRTMDWASPERRKKTAS